MYYKIILNSEIIGVGTSNDCLRFQSKHSILQHTTDELAEYIECNGLLYHAHWMQPIKTDIYSYTIADVIAIEEQEYDILAPAVAEETIPYEEPEYVPEVPIETADPVEEITLEYIRSSKISEMSYECRKAIEAGTDVIIRGQIRHFSMTQQDQLNFISLGTLAQTQDLIPYHADGESCVFYTANEINQIISATTTHKIYQTTYYNALKEYINSLETIEEIAAITYGTPIPDEYQSEVLKVIKNEN